MLGDGANAEVHAALPGSGLTITGTYAGNAGGVLSIIRSVRRAGPATQRSTSRRSGDRPRS